VNVIICLYICVLTVIVAVISYTFKSLVMKGFLKALFVGYVVVGVYNHLTKK